MADGCRGTRSNGTSVATQIAIIPPTDCVLLPYCDENAVDEAFRYTRPKGMSVASDATETATASTTFRLLNSGRDVDPSVLVNAIHSGSSSVGAISSFVSRTNTDPAANHHTSGFHRSRC